MKSRVLVIDDEAAIRDSLRMILEYEDYQFVGAASGQEGLDVVRRERPDIVLLDIKMPGMDGMEVLRKLRAVDEGLNQALPAGLALERELFVEVFRTEDSQIGVKSFLEQGPGKAAFTGR